MYNIPFFCAAVSFFVVLFMTPVLIRYLRKIGLLVRDQNKRDKPLVPISGGLAVVSGFLAGMMVFIFLRTFFFPSDSGIILDESQLSLLFASILTILIIAFIGFMDDLVVKSKDASSGLRQWQKPLLTLAAAVPLMVVNAGTHYIHVPFYGMLVLNVIYPLVLIPIGVVGAANMVNMFAGFNGLESGMGIIYTGMLGLYAFVNESYIAAFIALIVFVCLISFYFFNRYPARILPGDSLTYLLGATIAVIAIVGNIEKAALVISIPFFFEFVLKLRGRFKKQSYGYYKDGKVYSLYKKIYSIPHFFTRTGRFTERQVVWFCYLIEFVFALLIWVV